MNFELNEESKSWNPYCLLLKREREMKLLALVQAKIAFGSFINDFTNSTSGPDLNFSKFRFEIFFSKIPDFIFGMIFVYWARKFLRREILKKILKMISILRRLSMSTWYKIIWLSVLRGRQFVSMFLAIWRPMWRLYQDLFRNRPRKPRTVSWTKLVN